MFKISLFLKMLFGTLVRASLWTGRKAAKLAGPGATAAAIAVFAEETLRIYLEPLLASIMPTGTLVALPAFGALIVLIALRKS